MGDREAEEKLRREFNLWIADGRADGLERHHLSIAQQTFERMQLQPGERVLDLGCGTGWAARLMARLVAGNGKIGQVVGLDLSDEMIARARRESVDFDNLMFVWGSAESIPWGENYFDKVLSIEAFYYYPDLQRVLSELFRVMAPRASLSILINIYRDNPYSGRWIEKLQVPIHYLSAQEYADMLREQGFEEVAWHRIPDETPIPDNYQSKWGTAEELREAKRLGALLLVARKPDVLSPPSPTRLE